MNQFYYLIFATILFISNTHSSPKELPFCDILIYKKDTLFVDKVFENQILKAIERQANFKKRSSRLSENWYTAVWEIIDNRLYLIKVSNCQDLFCRNQTENDTLNLQQAFKKKQSNGKVEFTVRNKTLNAHDRYKLRKYEGWFPTYLIDYHFVFNKKKEYSLVTNLNYIDELESQNRYTYFQLKKQVYEILMMNTEVLNFVCENLIVDLDVIINNEGVLEKFEIFQAYSIVSSDSISVIEIDSISNFINFNTSKSILEKMKWDEIKNTNTDHLSFSFDISKGEKTVKSSSFEFLIERDWKSHLNELPWYIKRNVFRKE